MASTTGFSQALKRATARGRPIEVLISNEIIIDSAAADPSEELAQAIAAAAAVTEADGGAVVVPRGALSFGGLDRADWAPESDALIQGWLVRPSDQPRLSRMVRDARKAGVEVGLIDTAEGWTAAVCVANASSSQRWPLPPPLRVWLDAVPGRSAVAVMAPVRSGTLRDEIADAFGLTVIEAGVAAALMDAPSVEIAAARLKLPTGRAREALARAKRKIGASSTGAMTRLVLEAILRGSAFLPGLPDARWPACWS